MAQRHPKLIHLADEQVMVLLEGIGQGCEATLGPGDRPASSVITSLACDALRKMARLEVEHLCVDLVRGPENTLRATVSGVLLEGRLISPVLGIVNVDDDLMRDAYLSYRSKVLGEAPDYRWKVDMINTITVQAEQLLVAQDGEIAGLREQACAAASRIIMGEQTHPAAGAQRRPRRM